MLNFEDNPLFSIFKRDCFNNKIITNEISYIQNIPKFFIYLKDENNSNEKKISLIEELLKKIQKIRYITEYFSTYENNSIYIILFDLYLHKNTSNDLKNVIINLLNELRINIQTDKEIYEYLFQKIAKIFRNEEYKVSNKLYETFNLLFNVLDSTENLVNPKNYFAFTGIGKFSVDLSNKVSIINGFSIIMNFKFYSDNENNINNTTKKLSTLLKLKFSNDVTISFDLYSNGVILIKELQDNNNNNNNNENNLENKPIPINEWINLIITMKLNSGKVYFYFHINGENHCNNITFSPPNNNTPFRADDKVVLLEFFNNFQGEVSSLMMFSHRDSGNHWLTEEFLSRYKTLKEGIWKKKQMTKFLDLLPPPVLLTSRRNSSHHKLSIIMKPNTKNIKKSLITFESIVFIFSPFNYWNKNKNIVEDFMGRFKLKFDGNIQNHRYQCYQKNLEYVGGLINLLPISEMFLEHPETLNEKNFEMFLKIIVNILKDRKNNMKHAKKIKFFGVLSLFLEKYPKHLFTSKILEVFFEIGKTIFKNNLESLCENYFKHILLNEKILSKYNEKLQINFWNNIKLFCESDKSQIESLININRICLILRFYDKNKFTEMCCKDHLNMFKDEYVGSKKIMNPPMTQKLSNLKNIIDLIIFAQEPVNVLSLFKLLALDLSPCLSKFIINLFINAFKKSTTDNKWKNELIKILNKNQYETILINAFIHGLLDIKIDIIRLINEIYERLIVMNKTSYFKTFEKMLKTCFLPKEMFYIKNGIINEDYSDENNNIIDLLRFGRGKDDNERKSAKHNYQLWNKFSIKKYDSLKTKNFTNIKDQNCIEEEKNEDKENNELYENIENNNSNNNKKDSDNKNENEEKSIEKRESTIIIQSNNKIETINNNQNKENEDIIAKTNSDIIKSTIINNNNNNYNDNNNNEITPYKKETSENPNTNTSNNNQEQSSQNKNEEIQINKFNPISNNNSIENSNSQNSNNNSKNESNKSHLPPGSMKPAGFMQLLSKFDKTKKRKETQDYTMKSARIVKNYNKENEPSVVPEFKGGRTKKFMEEIEARINKQKQNELQKIKPKRKKTIDTKTIIKKDDGNSKKENEKKEKEISKNINIITIKNIDDKEDKNDNQNDKKNEKSELNINDQQQNKNAISSENNNIKEGKIEETLDKKENKTTNNQNNKELEKTNSESATILKSNFQKEEPNYKEKEPTQKEATLKKESGSNNNNNDNNFKILSSKTVKVINHPKIILSKRLSIMENFTPLHLKDNSDSNTPESNIKTTEPLPNDIFVLKEDLYQKYIDDLFSILILWSIGLKDDDTLNSNNLGKYILKNLNCLDFLFSLDKELKNIKFTIKIFDHLHILIKKPENNYNLLKNKKIFSSILDITFNNYRQTESDNRKCYDLGKSLLVNCFINSIIYMENNKTILPLSELEILFIWGDNLTSTDEILQTKEYLFEFFHDLFIELLGNFDKNFNEKIKFVFNIKTNNNNKESKDNKNKESEINSNYYLKNYLILFTQIYNYFFLYKLDSIITLNGSSFFLGQSKEINIPSVFITSMRVNYSKGMKFCDYWMDYKLLKEIYFRINFIWNKENTFKNKEITKAFKNYKNKNKFLKYEEIFNIMILDKEKKNIYQKELEFLCYEKIKDSYEIITPLIKIIPILLMTILSIIQNSLNEEDFTEWLKEFTNFIRFIIIASCNLTKNNQVEIYTELQNKCYETIASGLCFLYNLLKSGSICKEKIEKKLKSFMIFCFIITNYQYVYNKNNKKIGKKVFGFASKPSRNDLSGCSVFLLFNDCIGQDKENKEKEKEKEKEKDKEKDKDKDFDKENIEKNDTLLINQNVIEKIKKKNDYILEIINDNEWENKFFKNKNLKRRIEKNFYSQNSLEIKTKIRFSFIPTLLDELDYSYMKTILDILPLYEIELTKYSNNTLENNIKKKKNYKKIKKNAFSWRGFWSNRQIFFPQILSSSDYLPLSSSSTSIPLPPSPSSTIDIKYKLINHYTQNFMKPLLTPILDISYYLPTFSYFNPVRLFNDKNQNSNTNYDTKSNKVNMNMNNHKNYLYVNMDIDKILKASEINRMTLEKIKKCFGDTNKGKKIKENYLKYIYIKSNKSLANNLLRISNNLDFGKEEEFATVVELATRKTDQNNSETSNNNQKDKNIFSKDFYLCCLVKPSHHIKGVCFLSKDKLEFKVFLNQKTGSAMSGVGVGFNVNDDDYDPERETCFGSYFIYHKKNKDLDKVTIKFNEIKWILRKRYYYKNSGMEIFTTENKSFYFNFKEENDREIVLKGIKSNYDKLIDIVNDLKDNKDCFQNVLGFENSNYFLNILKNHKRRKKKNNDKIKLSKKISSWSKWKITNYEFLMWLNFFGNRSFDDISQYPVFPWTLCNYKDPLQVEQKVKMKMKEMKSSFFVSRAPTASTVEKVDESLSSSSLDNYENNNSFIDYLYRDLKLPMGMLDHTNESIERKELFLEDFNTMKSEQEEREDDSKEMTNICDLEIKPYLFGSNYSNPIYVCYYLMRLFPFTHISIELQGRGFDKADRMFLSVDKSFYCSSTQKTDVRELIPEFFYLPEMFMNINDLDLGILQDGTKVDTVETPCSNNPYEFTMIMRTVLESYKLSNDLNQWVDLIFGYKSSGKEAENAYNIFTESSYQENIDLSKMPNKEACLRMVEFGLIPTQLLSRECPKREKKENIKKGKSFTDSNIDIASFKCKIDSISANNKNDLLILKIGSFNPEKITIFLNWNMITELKIGYSVFDKSFSEEIVNIQKFIKSYNKISEINDDSNNLQRNYDKNIVFCDCGKSVIVGGFYDGKIVKIETDPKNLIREFTPFKEEVPVNAIAIDNDEQFVIVGNENGNIKVYKKNNIENDLEELYLIIDQFGEISHIDCSSELNMWVSASVDGFINLYTLPLCKLVRSIKAPVKKCNYVFLSSSPLPSIIVIDNDYNQEISEIFVYLINGHLNKRQNEQSIIYNPMIIKDPNNNDYLAYICNNYVIIRNLPDLILQVTTEEIPNIYTFCFSEDMKILYTFNQSGSEINVFKEG